MRRGLLRSISGLLGGAAFAVAVASPIQWCPCPMHGAALPAQAHHAQHMHGAAGEMPMPVADVDPSPAASHSSHGPGSSHTEHQCTCPGCSCSTTPVGLLTHTLRAPVAANVEVLVHVAEPSDTVEFAASPQLALPLANAPPVVEVRLSDAARYTT